MGFRRRTFEGSFRERAAALKKKDEPQITPISQTTVTVGSEANLAQLVSCPRNTRYFAGGQLAVFQGASEAPLSESYGSSEQRGKTANWPRPRGLR